MATDDEDDQYVDLSDDEIIIEDDDDDDLSDLYPGMYLFQRLSIRMHRLIRFSSFACKRFEVTGNLRRKHEWNKT